MLYLSRARIVSHCAIFRHLGLVTKLAPDGGLFYFAESFLSSCFPYDAIAHSQLFILCCNRVNIHIRISHSIVQRFFEYPPLARRVLHIRIFEILNSRVPFVD